MQEGKVVVSGGLQIAEEWRSEKQWRKRKIPNWIQSIVNRDKKAFLNGQYKEIEENNRMGKTRDLFRKTGERYQGKFSCKNGHNKGQKW